jgi:glyoxylate reductase
MSKPKVFITRKIAEDALAMIADIAEMEVWENELPPPHDVLLNKVKDIEGLLPLLSDKVDASLMNAATRLRVVSNMAVGYENIDVSAATSRGIIITNTPGVLTETTADFAFALLLGAARRVVEADAYTKKGYWKTWGPSILLGHDVHHATLGIVGLGRIGTAMAKRAKGFDMQVLYYDQVRKYQEEQELGIEFASSLPDLLSRADFITIHTPLIADTYHLISTKEFAVMKPTAILINASRGAVVDQKALYEALKSRHIFAAALDVTEVEPIQLDSPLLTLDNIIITPHIASASIATRTKMAIMAAANLIAGLRGEMPTSCVNPEVLKQKG